MPGLDRRGPAGSGPMTGGRRGLCGRMGKGAGIPAGEGFDYGRGRGFRRGAGRGFGPGRGSGRGAGWPDDGGLPVSAADRPSDSTEEINRLRAEADVAEKTLAAINNRIEALKNAAV